MATQITSIKVPVISALIHEIGQMRGLHKRTKEKILYGLADMEKVGKDGYRKKINLAMDEPDIVERPSEMLGWAFDHAATWEGEEFWKTAIARLEKVEARTYGLLDE